MSTTNFFEITITPPIETLYVSDAQINDIRQSSNNIITNLTKQSILSLYPLAGSQTIDPQRRYIEWLLKRVFFDELERSTSVFDIDYRRGEFTILDERLFQSTAYSILWRVAVRIFYAEERLILSIDPFTKIYNRVSVDKLINNHGFALSDFVDHDCLAFIEKRHKRIWAHGKVRGYNGLEVVKVEVPSLFKGTIEVSPNRVLPSLPVHLLANIAAQQPSRDDLFRRRKQLSSLTARRKLEVIEQFFHKYVGALFPLVIEGTTFSISSEALETSQFTCYQILTRDEPEYVVERPEFGEVRGRRRLNTLSEVDITSPPKEHNVVLFATQSSISDLENVITKLNEGVRVQPYHVSLPEQFGIKLIVTDRFVVSDYDEYLEEADTFLLSTEEQHQDALALVYLPQQSELYYPFKAKLAHYGKISQVISQPQMDIYGIWNLATNIYAKLSYAPWGISGSSDAPSADIVLGFAYSSLKESGRLRRTIGYVNVFDKHGVWLFMQSSADFLDFQNRKKIIPEMIRKAIVAYSAGRRYPKIIDIHYSKRFSYDERKATIQEVRAVVPRLDEINFISIDHTHPLRVFDMGTTSQNLQRGKILQLNPGEFLLSVATSTNANALASRLLKVRVWRESTTPEQIDIQPIAYRILAMTNLNWRSAVRETNEPVTLKYAEEIAKMTNHFSLTEWRDINNQLNNVPWFI